MSRGRLQVVPVPWMVSPSVPELRIGVTENGDSRVTLDVVLLPSAPSEPSSDLVTRGVEIIFRHGQWVRTHPAARDMNTLPPALFDQAAVEFSGTDDPKDWVHRFRSEWRSQGDCPDPRFYEVLGSSWILEENAERFGCRHFVLVGHDLWMEVLCTGVNWHWAVPGAASVDPQVPAGRSSH